jgi:small GTP-binding protein
MSVDLKLVLLGHKNVGKTSLFNRYIYDEYGKTSMTIGAYFGMKQCRVRDRSCNLAIWDTAGEEKFDSLTNFYCRNARAALVCYDITSQETFQKLQRWVDKVTSEAEENCVMIIVGNKLDIVEANPELRQVDTAAAEQYATSVGAQVVEVSAKSGKNVNDIFEKLVSRCFDQLAEGLYDAKPRRTFPEARRRTEKTNKCC